MQARETVTSSLILLGLLVLARWAWTQFGGDPPGGPLGYFDWAAYLVAGVLVFSIVGSAAAGTWFLVQRAFRSDEIAGEARKLKAEATFLFVDAAGGQGPYELCRIRLVPALALVDVEFRIGLEPVSGARMDAMRAIVNDAVERIQRDAAPGTWVGVLQETLAGLHQHDLVLRGPSGGFYWYDPPEARK